MPTKIREKAPQQPEGSSEAPSSLAVYTGMAILGWQNSLLLPTLKPEKLIRLQLHASGTGVIGDTLPYFKMSVHYRDGALSPDGTKIYLAVDSTSVTSGPSKEDPQQISFSYKGCIVEFTYQGKSNPPKKITGTKAALAPGQQPKSSRRATERSPLTRRDK